MSKSLHANELLPSSSLLTVTSVQHAGARWTVWADGPTEAACVTCGRVSRSPHSRYVRTLTDLPACGVTVSLKIRVRRWRCYDPGCPVRCFADRLPGVADVRARRTRRAAAVAHLISYALGGRPGARLARRLGLPLSKDTLLRSLKARAPPAGADPRTVGVDEWAKRKGWTYGTIIVDLERRTVVDVLDDYSTESVERWLRQHPGVHTICRDRNGRYAKAARRAMPEAVQVADRFHLVQNLREAIERDLAGRRPYLRVAFDAEPPVQQPVDTPRPGIPRERHLPPARRLATQVEIRRQRRTANLARFARFKRLQATGRPIAAIARELDCNRRRLDRWAKHRELPPRQKMAPRPGSAESFRGYLEQRWAAGCGNACILFEELRAQGFPGTYKAVSTLVSPWRLGNVPAAAPVDTAPAPPPAPLPPSGGRQLSPQFAAALITRPRADLSPRDARFVEVLKAGCPGYATMRTLMLRFRALVTHGGRSAASPEARAARVVALHDWMDAALATGIGALRAFVRRAQQDILAVEAAVTLPWSNGPVEGHINRLKMLKRQMYGRASVELLRARVLPLQRV